MNTQAITLELNGAAPDVLIHPYLLDNSPEVEPERHRPLVMICPGGGYAYRSFREAEPVAVRLLGLGMSACVIDYSVAPARFPAAMLQVLAAVAYAREHAEAWHIDPVRIILMGFSAGGHLAASAGVFWSKPHYAAKLGLESEQVRPNGLALCYPVITAGSHTHEDTIRNLLGDDIDILRQTVSLEKQVSSQTPPTFLFHTWDDGAVPVENTLLFAAALKQQGVPATPYIYPKGVHGISLSNQEVFGPDGFAAIRDDCAQWIGHFDAWRKGL